MESHLVKGLHRKLGLGLAGLLVFGNVAFAKDFKLHTDLVRGYEEYAIEYGDREDNAFDYFSLEVYAYQIHEGEWVKIYNDEHGKLIREYIQITDMPKDVKNVIEILGNSNDLLVIGRYLRDGDLMLTFHPKYWRDKEFHQRIIDILNREMKINEELEKSKMQKKWI